MSAKLNNQSVVVAAKEQVSCDFNGEAVVLNLQAGMYYGVGGVGTRIWSVIQKPATVGQIRDIIAREFDVDLERCEKDVLNFVEQLVNEGLAEVTNALPT